MSEKEERMEKTGKENRQEEKGYKEKRMKDESETVMDRVRCDSENK